MQVENASAQARQIVQSKLVWDNHACLPLKWQDTTFLPQLQRYRASGVDVLSLNVGFDSLPWENTVLMLAHFRRWIRQHRDQYLLIESIEDIEHARSHGLLGICFDLEGGTLLNEQLAMVELYYDLGARWMLLAYNQNNSLGGGCQDDDQGLTAFGKQVLDEMARVGMVACCSHSGYRTTMDVIEYSAGPVIFSHSNPVALCKHKRNITDEAIRACAQTGGVICLNGFAIFLGDSAARTQTFVRHIDHVVQLVGSDHVGLGLDYVFDMDDLDDYVRQNPTLFPPAGGYGGSVKMLQPEQIVDIVEGMLQLGYRTQDIGNILGGNLLRVASGVWK